MHANINDFIKLENIIESIESTDSIDLINAKIDNIYSDLSIIHKFWFHCMPFKLPIIEDYSSLYKEVDKNVLFPDAKLLILKLKENYISFLRYCYNTISDYYINLTSELLCKVSSKEFNTYSTIENIRHGIINHKIWLKEFCVSDKFDLMCNFYTLKLFENSHYLNMNSHQKSTTIPLVNRILDKIFKWIEFTYENFNELYKSMALTEMYNAKIERRHETLSFECYNSTVDINFKYIVK